MSSLNKVMLLGNLGRDPEVRTMNNGSKVVTLNIATSEKWKDKNTQEHKEKTEWHRVVVFNENLARIAEQYLKKGTTVYLEGALQTRKYTNQQGQEVYTTEVVLQQYRGEMKMLGGRGDGSNQQSNGGYNDSSQKGPTDGGFGGSDGSDLDDDMPF